MLIVSDYSGLWTRIDFENSTLVNVKGKGFVMQNLLSLLEEHGIPQWISWGCHEGIRGANWIDVQADGAIKQRHYIPNSSALVDCKQSGHVSRKRYRELLAQISSIPFEELTDGTCSTGALLPDCFTLECVWKDARWEFALPLTQHDNCDAIRQLSETFLHLTRDASVNSDD